MSAQSERQPSEPPQREPSEQPRSGRQPSEQPQPQQESPPRSESESGRARGYDRFRDLGAMARATFLGACPNCGRATMFRNLYAVHETCPACGVRFERDTGSWLGALVMTYGAAIVALVLLSLLLIPRYGLFEGFGLTLAGAAIATVLLVYRPAKGWWIWWMWAAGFVYRDDDRSGARKG